ncbi:MAG: hypothetical protein B7O98_08335 [Zestosphaera tikiterensis]|uniref:Solute-binding protein family 5 domain-containing protein n=1 Tax=Zestosphaera tikiterensis TaxID=1973259 RepID=A0A2R7Y362_9CREN|nr:MAG: hypothetical protein B7O98_08335 [Zestosphaera tikiterensis]
MYRYSSRFNKSLLALGLTISILTAYLIGFAGVASAAPEEQVLKVGIPGEIDNFNPFTGILAAAGYVRGLLYQTLLILPANRSYTPWLAESFTVDQNALKVVFKLRPNLRWDDGTPLTSKDVVFTFNLILNSTYSKVLDKWNLRNYIEYVKALDDRTVEFKLKSPFAPVLWYLGAQVAIVPEHIWSKVNVTEFKNLDNPVGCGPYKFVKYTPGVSVELEANPYFFLGKPKIQRLVVVLYKSVDALMLDLQAGNIDAIYGSVAPELVPVLLKNPNVRVALPLASMGSMRFMGFNLEKYPFNITEFRWAIAYAINKEAIVNTVMLGYAEPAADGWVQPVQGIWYNPNVTYVKQNLTKAKEILDKLGFIDRNGDGIRETPDGKPLSISILTISGRPEFERSAELIMGWLKQIGIDARVEAQALGTVDQREGVGDFDIGLMGLAGLGNDVDWWIYERFHSSQAPPLGTYAPRNWFRYRNPEADQLLDAQRSTLDLELRKQYIYKLQEIIARDKPLIPLYVTKPVTAYRIDKFEGWNEVEGPTSILSLMSLKPKGPEVITVATTVVTSVTQPVTQPVTITQTQAVTVATTVTSPVTSPTPTEVPWSLYAVVIVVVVVILAFVAFRVARKT